MTKDENNNENRIEIKGPFGFHFLGMGPWVKDVVTEIIQKHTIKVLLFLIFTVIVCGICFGVWAWIRYT